MKIGLAFDLKEKVPAHHRQTDDALEEYDSRETVDGIAGALTALGHSPVLLGGGRDLLEAVLREKVDLVFNISEGLGNYRSREAQVPGVLEMLDIPYTGSDPQCLAICLDKPLTKQLVALAGISVPQSRTISNINELADTGWEDFPLPAIIKPAHEGSSKGVLSSCFVNSAREIDEVSRNWLERYRQPVMVEEFIGGDEITVGVVGNTHPRVIGIMRILPRNTEAPFVYSLEVKRDWERLVDYECPAKLDPHVLKAIEDASLRLFSVLGCRDFARIDFRLGAGGTPYFLEINPLPGLNPRSSDLVILAKKMGWSYEALIGAVLGAALERYPQCARQ
ncbi:MAG: ATP-grasp domain-containing protein [Chloroflexi bacterium]|nr:ATP-grasp domain-containing protein [Chloroflexota bacterium]